MAIQFSNAVANAMLDQIEASVGSSAVLRIRSGAVPANCAAADSGTVLATITLPADWMLPASAGSKSKSGVWQTTSALATGTAGHYRLYAADGTTCHQQGTITATGGGGDLTLDGVLITILQTVTISSWTWGAQV